MPIAAGVRALLFCWQQRNFCPCTWLPTGQYCCCAHLALFYALQASSTMHMPPRMVRSDKLLAAMLLPALVSD